MGTLALGPPGSVTQEKQEMDTSPFFIYVLKLTQLQGFSSSSFFFGHVKAIIISAATNILAQIFWWIFEHVSVEYVLVVEWNRWGSSGRQVGRGVWTVDGEK